MGVANLIFTPGIELGIFSSSHEGLCLVRISHTYLHNSHLTLEDSGGSCFFIFILLFLHISFIFSSYFFRLRARKERGEEDRFKEGGVSQISYVPTGVELGIYLNPQRPMVGRNFPHLSSRLAPRFDSGSNFLHNFFFLFLQHLGPKRGGGTNFNECPREFHIYLWGEARNFSKSYRGVWLVKISHGGL